MDWTSFKVLVWPKYYYIFIPLTTSDVYRAVVYIGFQYRLFYNPENIFAHQNSFIFAALCMINVWIEFVYRRDIFFYYYNASD